MDAVIVAYIVAAVLTLLIAVAFFFYCLLRSPKVRHEVQKLDGVVVTVTEEKQCPSRTALAPANALRGEAAARPAPVAVAPPDIVVLGASDAMETGSFRRTALQRGIRAANPSQVVAMDPAAAAATAADVDVVTEHQEPLLSSAVAGALPPPFIAPISSNLLLCEAMNAYPGLRTADDRHRSSDTWVVATSPVLPPTALSPVAAAVHRGMVEATSDAVRRDTGHITMTHAMMMSHAAASTPTHAIPAVATLLPSQFIPAAPAPATAMTATATTTTASGPEFLLPPRLPLLPSPASSTVAAVSGDRRGMPLVNGTAPAPTACADVCSASSDNIGEGGGPHLERNAMVPAPPAAVVLGGCAQSPAHTVAGLSRPRPASLSAHLQAAATTPNLPLDSAGETFSVRDEGTKPGTTHATAVGASAMPVQGHADGRVSPVASASRKLGMEELKSMLAGKTAAFEQASSRSPYGLQRASSSSWKSIRSAVDRRVQEAGPDATVTISGISPSSSISSLRRVGTVGSMRSKFGVGHVPGRANAYLPTRRPG